MSTVTSDASPSAVSARGTGRPTDWPRMGGDLLSIDTARQTAFDRRASEGRVIYKSPSSREEYLAAFRLVYMAYVHAGLATPNPYQMRVTPYHLLPTTEVFVAKRDDRVISTMSLIRDAQLGLPLEAVYEFEVAQFRSHGYTLAEVSCLADDRQGQNRSLPVVMRLMSLMAQSARERGVDLLLIAVHPRHARFYEEFAAFEVAGKERPYHTVCDRPAVAMALDLNWARIHHPRLYHRFFGTPFPDDVLRYRPMPCHVREELRRVAHANRVFTPHVEFELPAAG